MTIAVLDAGFMNVDRIPAFKKVKILGTRNFVAGYDNDVYKEMDHGTKTLSVIAMDQPKLFVGTAPRLLSGCFVVRIILRKALRKRTIG